MLKNMQTNTSPVDYAYPCMMAENALKEAHIHMLNHEYDEAIEEGLKAIAETKLMINAIRHEKEKQVQA